jgi:hypothetical protein
MPLTSVCSTWNAGIWNTPAGDKMPYEIKADGDDYLVINKDTGEEKARHTPPDAKEKAERQVKLLEGIENDPGWDE